MLVSGWLAIFVSVVQQISHSQLFYSLTLSAVEAEMAQNRITELKEQEFQMNYQQMIFTHQ